MNKVDLVEDPEFLELGEMEIRDLLKFYGFDGEKTPVIQGSALGGLNGEEKWVEKDRRTDGRSRYLDTSTST